MTRDEIEFILKYTFTDDDVKRAKYWLTHNDYALDLSLKNYSKIHQAFKENKIQCIQYCVKEYYELFFRLYKLLDLCDYHSYEDLKLDKTKMTPELLIQLQLCQECHEFITNFIKSNFPKFDGFVENLWIKIPKYVDIKGVKLNGFLFEPSDCLWDETIYYEFDGKIKNHYYIQYVHAQHRVVANTHVFEFVEQGLKRDNEGFYSNMVLTIYPLMAGYFETREEEALRDWLEEIENYTRWRRFVNDFIKLYGSAYLEHLDELDE